MCKLSQPTTANTNPPWHHAIWVGRDSTANDIIVALDNGTVKKVRTIKRMPPDQQCDRKLLLSVTGLPENPRGMGKLDKEFIVQLRYLQDLQLQHETGKTRDQRTEDYKTATEMKRPEPVPPQNVRTEDGTEVKPPEPFAPTEMDLDEPMGTEEDSSGPQGATGSGTKRNADNDPNDQDEDTAKRMRIHTLNNIETKKGMKTVEVNEDHEEKELIKKLSMTYQEFPLDKLAKGMKRERDQLRSFPAFECSTEPSS